MWLGDSTAGSFIYASLRRWKGFSTVSAASTTSAKCRVQTTDILALAGKEGCDSIP